jgi:hypothetical protein
MFPLIANSLWYLSSLPESLAFYWARRNLADTQQRLLLNLLHRNASTEFGRRYGFVDLRSVGDYQRRVPLTTYDDYAETIERIGAGQPEVLTHEPVRLLEPTSGSTAASKYIPYPPSLKADFQRAITPWIVNLFSHRPGLLVGQAYWSVSPVTRQNERTPAGLPIGFEEDSEYLSGWQRHLLHSVLAVPPLVRLIDNMVAFRYITLLFLLRSRSLALISVWNPTFLTLLVEPLPDWCNSLCADIATGTLSPPAPLPSVLRSRLAVFNRPNPHRAEEIRAIFQANPNPAELHARLWPRLRLISCWADAQAARYIAPLARLFPQAEIQGKGLIATEGFVSFPVMGLEGAALAVRSHFFEFLPEEENAGDTLNVASAHQTPLLAHQLKPDGSYTVIITTGGGLYRYQLHDVVQVTGFWGDCPLLRFIGKEAYISDWFGEKLNERHVRRVLDDLLARYQLDPPLAMLAGDDDLGRPAYTLFIETAAPDTTLLALSNEVEAALQENYHYRYCRQLGQLEAVRLFRIDSGATQTYLNTCQAHGQRPGDIKPAALHRLRGWSNVFQGRPVYRQNC